MADKLMSDAGLKTAGQDLQSTFSARYSDSRHDEGEWIDRVLDATDCRPHTTVPSGEKLLNELDDLVWHHEEPFGSTSIFAQWSLFKLVKQSAEVGVKVTLDGQGGDELLGGYHRYFATYLANLAGKQGSRGAALRARVIEESQKTLRVRGWLGHILLANTLTSNLLSTPLHKVP